MVAGGVGRATWHCAYEVACPCPCPSAAREDRGAGAAGRVSCREEGKTDDSREVAEDRGSRGVAYRPSMVRQRGVAVAKRGAWVVDRHSRGRASVGEVHHIQECPFVQLKVPLFPVVEIRTIGCG